MKKKLFLILTVMTILFPLFSIRVWSTSKEAGPSYKGETAESLWQLAINFLHKGSSEENLDLEKASKPFVEIGQLLMTVAIIVLTIATLVMGIKYMMATTDKKATIKKQLIGLIVSALVIFSAYTIWEIASNLLMQSVEGEDQTQHGGSTPQTPVQTDNTKKIINTFCENIESYYTLQEQIYEPVYTSFVYLMKSLVLTEEDTALSDLIEFDEFGRIQTKITDQEMEQIIENIETNGIDYYISNFETLDEESQETLRTQGEYLINNIYANGEVNDTIVNEDEREAIKWLVQQYQKI